MPTKKFFIFSNKGLSGLTLPYEELIQLKQSDPQKYYEVITRLRATVPPDVIQQERLKQLAIIAASGTGEEEFKAFYEGMHGNPLLPHNERANKLCEQAFEEGKIFLYHAARGLRKTSTFIVTKAVFLIGHFPHLTSIFTGAAEKNSINIAKNIAQLIEFHPFFKMVFPHIVIHKEMGWGAEGYWLRDGRMSIEEWTKQQAKTIDPTFIGGGYQSNAINGRHPTLILGVDDLHDIDSSKSSTEREAIRDKFLTQILKSVIYKDGKLQTKIMMTGVPFAKDDTYAVLRETGGTIYYGVPAMKRAKEGEEGAVYVDGVNQATGRVYEDIVGWWVLVCPEIYDVERIIKERAIGKGGFWQMVMIDIDIAKTAGLLYYTNPAETMGFNLPTYGGADPTGVDPNNEVGGKQRSSFALCYLCDLTNGKAAVKDGILKPMGIEKAKLAILQAQTMFSNWNGTGVEDVGVGKMFLQYLRLDSRVLAFDSNIKTPGKKGVADKLTRFEYEVAPHLESGKILISDADTPFLNALRSGLDNFFDLDPKRPDERLDAMDSFYHAVKMIPDILRKVVSDDISPQGLNNRGGLWHPLMGVVNGQNGYSRS